MKKWVKNFLSCISIDNHEVREEQSAYRDLPRFYSFGTREEREQFLMEHLQGVYREVDEIGI